MPELPEVQTITTDLNKNLKGFTIKNVNVYDFEVYPDKKTFLEQAVGTTIQNVKRIAKNIVIELDKDIFLSIHLAMTGQLLFKNPHDEKVRWERVTFKLEKDGKALDLRYSDMRKFGKVKVLTEENLAKLTKKYGPDILNADLNSQEFLKILRSKNTNIKNALLDQKLVSGIGNIYATDALFLAGIHPKTKTRDLDIKSAEKLLDKVQQILRESIQHRGSTLADKSYVDAFGRYGKHQNFFRIYGKSTCVTCNKTVEFEKINGRGTYFCSNCQKLLEKRDDDN